MKWIALLLVVMTTVADASPRDELASPVQATRDAAAKQIRATFKPSPRAQWDKVVASIKKGTTEQAMLAQLAPYKPTPEGGAAGGGGSTMSYRIDDSWIIVCAFTTADMKLFEIKLVPSVRDLWVEPPKGFTGVWTTYRANGVRSHEIHYQGGTYAGTFTSFHEDGSKSVVQTYGPKGVTGDDTGYYPSGKLAYKGQYLDGKRIGTWTHYDETGKVTSIEIAKP
ncbi:MAG: hypothetical protein ABI867_24205 [Kofleriaceae bacterium]